MRVSRRDLLASTAMILGSGLAAHAGVISGGLPWRPDAGNPPSPVVGAGWLYFNAAEAASIEALADRLIPPDPQTPGGKEAGCAVFIDRQLAGPYGRRQGLYIKPPFVTGLKQQGPQSPDDPAQQYRKGLSALDGYCRSAHGGKRFVELNDNDKDAVLSAMESGSASFSGVKAQDFFELLIKDVQEGFFADPIYGGNRDMAGWKMIGFPGARYDYRDWVSRHNERFPLPPVGIAGRVDWTPRKS